MHILGFEPFDAGSHRAVRESISRHSAHRWTWLTRPGRAWKWRMRTAAIELADQVAEVAHDIEDVDVVFATSLMSVSDLRALLPAAFRNTPIVLYMHENQAAYPAGEAGPDERDAHFLLTNLTSAAAADRVIFNSEWNRRSLLAGLRELVKHSRDGQLGRTVDRIEAKSCIIWPPVESPPMDLERQSAVLHKPVRVVWPHRWEHDKGPDELLEIARQYTRQCNLRWIILGERYRNTPESMQAFQREFADCIEHCGYVEDHDEYWRWLSRAEWVLSTARHEFFGIAVVEAMLAGALPWLPARLSYPELLPECAKGLSPLDPPADVAAIQREIRHHLRPAIAENAVGAFDVLLQELCANNCVRA